MNLKELKSKIEWAKSCRTDSLADGMSYFFEIYIPVSEAIAENNKTVIEYFLNCESSDRLCMLNAIEDGAKILNLLKSYKLRGIIKKDKKNKQYYIYSEIHKSQKQLLKI